MTYDFKIRSAVNEKGKTAYFAQRTNSDEKEFFIGFSTKYQERFGLYNATQPAALIYKASDYDAEFGFFAHFIEPTTKVESNSSFICLNTYDRAFFTFGFMQFAVHVPNGDFIKFFKKLLLLPNAKLYFPRLELKDNRIFYISNEGQESQLEFDDTSKKLMEYFNPTTNEVERQELICSARMIHWATHDADHRKLQVNESINLYKNNLPKYHKRFNLNNYPAKVCFMICDILHQGRGSYDRISYALDTTGDYEAAYLNLCSIGEVQYSERIKSLKNQITILENNGVFNKKYIAGTNTFN